MSLFTAMYTPEESACYAASVMHSVSESLERKPRVLEKETALRSLARKSKWYAQFCGKPPREIGVAPEDQSAVATKGTWSSSAGVEGSGPTTLESDEESRAEEPEAYQKMSLLELDAEGGGEALADPWLDRPDTDPWYILADGLAAARVDDKAEAPAPDGNAEEEDSSLRREVWRKKPRSAGVVAKISVSGTESGWSERNATTGATLEFHSKPIGMLELLRRSLPILGGKSGTSRRS